MSASTVSSATSARPAPVDGGDRAVSAPVVATSARLDAGRDLRRTAIQVAGVPVERRKEVPGRGRRRRQRGAPDVDRRADRRRGEWLAPAGATGGKPVCEFDPACKVVEPARQSGRRLAGGEEVARPEDGMALEGARVQPDEPERRSRPLLADAGRRVHRQLRRRVHRDREHDDVGPSGRVGRPLPEGEISGLHVMPGTQEHRCRTCDAERLMAELVGRAEEDLHPTTVSGWSSSISTSSTSSALRSARSTAALVGAAANTNPR